MATSVPQAASSSAHLPLEWWWRHPLANGHRFRRWMRGTASPRMITQACSQPNPRELCPRTHGPGPAQHATGGLLSPPLGLALLGMNGDAPGFRRDERLVCRWRTEYLHGSRGLCGLDDTLA